MEANQDVCNFVHELGKVVPRLCKWPISDYESKHDSRCDCEGQKLAHWVSLEENYQRCQEHLPQAVPSVEEYRILRAADTSIELHGLIQSSKDLIKLTLQGMLCAFDIVFLKLLYELCLCFCIPLG